MNMDYQLKDKIQVTKEFLNELAVKSWQDIEHLQNQIANIEAGTENIQLVRLLKNLLTSYYVFAGGVENLVDGDIVTEPAIKLTDSDSLVNNEDCTEIVVSQDEYTPKELSKPAELPSDSTTNNFEPFEYFVDFDEPSGERLSDEDLYGKQ